MPYRPAKRKEIPLNVQNIPRKDTTVKGAFKPKLDALFFCDYPNIELKLLAWYLDNIGHPSMADFFRDDPGGDLHIVTAAGVYNKPLSQVTEEERQVGKTLNFSIVYGGGTPTLIKQGVAADFSEALDMLRQFHTTWPGIGWATKSRPASEGTFAWHIAKRMAERGYISTLWGRHLHPRSPHSSINALCQGCAADLIKWAMIQVHEWMEKEGLVSHMVNMVHDDLMLDAVEYELPQLARVVPDLMTYKLIQDVVPIRPEPEVSFTTWAEKEIYAQGK